MKKTTLLPLLAALGLAGPTACVTSSESDVETQAAPADDPDYAPALAKATQSRTVFKDFETRYSVTAIYLSPEFRHAFAKRLERVYLQERTALLDEASAKAGFFVSIQSPASERTDLGNPQHWTIMMGAKEGPLKPVLVKKLSDKERWRAFFPSVNTWTSEYLLVFDVPPVNPGSPELVEKPRVTLTFANADAKVELGW